MTERHPIEAMIRRFIFDPVPHHRSLGLELLACVPGRAVVRLPYASKLASDAATGILHGGAITSLLDTTGGCAAFSALTEPRRVATLDLRIDYMRAARPHADVVASAECVRMTRSVAFIRGLAHDGDERDPIATCAATFVVFPRKPTKPRDEAAA